MVTFVLSKKMYFNIIEWLVIHFTTFPVPAIKPVRKHQKNQKRLITISFLLSIL